MTRGRGNKTTAVEREARKARAVKMLNDGVPKGVVQAELGVSRMTLWRYLQDLQKDFQQVNLGEYCKLVEEQDRVLRMAEQILLEGQASPELINAWRGIRKDLADLHGLDKAKKSAHMHLHAVMNVDPSTPVSEMTDDQLFVRMAMRLKDLSPGQWQQVFDFADSLPQETEEDWRNAESARGERLIAEWVQPEPDPVEQAVITVALDPETDDEEPIQ